MSKCLVTRFESAICHIEIADMEGVVKTTPWMQDRQVIRPVLDTSRQQPEFVAHAEEAAVLAVIQFLEGRFGSMADAPRLCQAQEHRPAKTFPLAWTDELEPARQPRTGRML